MIEISSKQAEYIRNANKRYNVKMGATQSGKTHLDGLYVIPSRLLERKGKDGINVIVGVSKETIERNVLNKLRQVHGNSVVSEINNRNVAKILGEKVYCLGAKDKGQVSVFRGLTAKYIYIDEFPDISEDVFSIFASRLSLPYSVADMTGNPKDPSHWSEKWLAKVQNLYFQRYTLFDNPFLDEDTRQSIVNDYEGTVYYDRYVLGLPKRAEGIVFPQFSNDPTPWLISAEEVPKHLEYVSGGFDIGGNLSAYAYCVSAIDYQGNVYFLYAKKTQAQELAMEDVVQLVDKGVTHIEGKYKQEVEYTSTDHIDVIINQINQTTRHRAGKTYKPPLEDRPFLLSKLLASQRLFIVEEDCKDLIEEMQNLVFDDKQERAVVLDDGTMQIDMFDSAIYSLADNWHRLTD